MTELRAEVLIPFGVYRKDIKLNASQLDIVDGNPAGTEIGSAGFDQQVDGAGLGEPNLSI